MHFIANYYYNATQNNFYGCGRQIKSMHWLKGIKSSARGFCIRDPSIRSVHNAFHERGSG